VQRNLLLEGKAALDPDSSSSCMAGWSDTTYPCDNNTPQWSKVCGCVNGVVTALCLADCSLT
jgi:hypothetical protein